MSIPSCVIGAEKRWWIAWSIFDSRTVFPRYEFSRALAGCQPLEEEENQRTLSKGMIHFCLLNLTVPERNFYRKMSSGRVFRPCANGCAAPDWFCERIWRRSTCTSIVSLRNERHCDYTNWRGFWTLNRSADTWTDARPNALNCVAEAVACVWILCYKWYRRKRVLYYEKPEKKNRINQFQYHHYQQQ